MSSHLDDRIRRLMRRAVADAPPPPRYPVARALTAGPKRRYPGWVVAAGAGVVTLLLAGGAAWMFSGSTASPDDAATDLVHAIPTPVNEAIWHETGRGTGLADCGPCSELLADTQAFFVEIEHTGAGYFQVLAHGQDGDPLPDNGLHGYEGYLRLAPTEGEAPVDVRAVMVDTDGTYLGRILLPFEEPVTRFEVRSQGDWSIGVFPMESAPVLGRTVSGVGDDVVQWFSPAPAPRVGDVTEPPVPALCNVDRMVADHSVPGRLLVLGWGAMGNLPVLFDEEGKGRFEIVEPFSEPLPDGFCDGFFFVEVHADGPWTLTLVGAVGG